MNIHIQPPTFSGFTEYPSDTTNGQRGNGGRGGMHLNSSLERWVEDSRRIQNLSDLLNCAPQKVPLAGQAPFSESLL